MGWYDRKVRRVRDLSCGDTRIFLELEVRRLDCRHCGKVKRELLDFLADNPLYTKRFAYYVGRRCRSATIKDVAAELKLDWHNPQAPPRGVPPPGVPPPWGHQRHPPSKKLKLPPSGIRVPSAKRMSPVEYARKTGCVRMCPPTCAEPGGPMNPYGPYARPVL